MKDEIPNGTYIVCSIRTILDPILDHVANPTGMELPEDRVLWRGKFSPNSRVEKWPDAMDPSRPSGKWVVRFHHESEAVLFYGQCGALCTR